MGRLPYQWCQWYRHFSQQYHAYCRSTLASRVSFAQNIKFQVRRTVYSSQKSQHPPKFTGKNTESGKWKVLLASTGLVINLSHDDIVTDDEMREAFMDIELAAGESLLEEFEEGDIFRLPREEDSLQTWIQEFLLRFDHDDGLSDETLVPTWHHKHKNERCYTSEPVLSLHLKSSTRTHISKWQSISSRTSSMKIWRRPVAHLLGVEEYFVRGSFEDISARTFFTLQVDLDLRRDWDPESVLLEMLDRKAGSELVRWIVRFPLGMAHREYIFVRRAALHSAGTAALLVNRSTMKDATEPNDQSTVRVQHYRSTMLVKPHTTFDQPGLDYFLLYYDDPRVNIQKSLFHYAAVAGIQNLMKGLHKAALRLENSAERGDFPQMSYYAVNLKPKRTDTFLVGSPL